MRVILFCLISCYVLLSPRYGFSQPERTDIISEPIDRAHTSTTSEALVFIDSISLLPVSREWPNIDPVKFIHNLRLSVQNPVSIYPGRETNFCGYGALTYLLVTDDPLGYVRTLVDLYLQGKADYGRAKLRPSPRIRQAAGKLRFKGVLDIRPAEQLWYLVLADHYKGYLNIFNREYDAGDENTMWAAMNYAKFNRMARQLLNYHVKARGSDLYRPSVKHTEDYILPLLQKGTVVLYLNNRILHKKKLDKIKLAIPTHYVVLEKLQIEGQTLTIQYWDYGSKTLRQMTPAYFRKLVFGISFCTKQPIP